MYERIKVSLNNRSGEFSSYLNENINLSSLLIQSQLGMSKYKRIKCEFLILCDERFLNKK